MCNNNIQKVSIRFFNDREVRAVWDETLSKWWFSVLDVVGVLNNQDDYTKNRNYWKYLKTKLKKEGNELVSATNQLKLLAQDGKRYKTDVLDTEDIPSVRRNPVIADIFAQLGYMERKGSGMGKIINPIKTLPYFEEKMLPSFFSYRAQFTVTFPNMILAWQESHPGIEGNIMENDDVTQGVTQGVTQADTQGDTQGDTEDVPQGVPQDVPQGGTQGDDLDKWIEYQVAVYPKITTAELAQQSGKSIITIKRRIAKMPHIVYIGSGYSGHWEVRKKK